MHVHMHDKHAQCMLRAQVNLAGQNALAAAMLAGLGLGYLCSRKAVKKAKCA